ncbi:calcium-binding protein [Salipiger aestuarii]|uniref:hypothetical protein n=1 Tax=Salipiger aestuarii TaxID=568098 RepID=UPI0016807985|nr:hypothetical protein [Salipiger aestuarii]
MNGVSSEKALYGKAGADFLFAHGGDDTVTGGAGNDTLFGGYGADRLTGGADADTFVSEAGSGRDMIDDFEAGRDRLVFSSLLTDGRTDEAAVLADCATTFSGAVLFDFGEGNALWLTGVSSTYGLGSDMLIV